MRRPRRQTILVAALLVLIAGAAAIAVSRLASAPDPAQYFPLAHGARWEYGVEGAHFDRLVSTATAAGDEGGTPTYVVEVVVVDTGDIWHMATYSYGDDGVIICDLAWEEGGIHYIQSDPVYLLRGPLKEGRSWSWETRYTDATGREPDMVLEATFTVGPREAVDVPAGTFADSLQITRVNRFRVRDQWYEVSQVLWYAPGVGLVLEEQYRDGALAGRCFLTSWDPGSS